MSIWFSPEVTIVKMFEEGEVHADLDARLVAAGIDPTDTTVRAVKRIVSTYFAERTADVLSKVNEALKTFGNGAQ
ncbi:MAG: hypothetical protein JO205_09185 [Pseudolabrys sp.]|nr:hypothetical protein [Pseudolabrys sp.]